MRLRSCVGAIAALVVVVVPASCGLAHQSLIVSGVPGYVHIPSDVDGKINAAGLLLGTGHSLDAATFREAKNHSGEAATWDSIDNTTHALVWVLDYGTPTSATLLSRTMTSAALQDGVQFEAGVSGTEGVGITNDDGYVYTVFWRQGSHVASVNVVGSDLERVKRDVKMFTRLEAEALNRVIGGERVAFGLFDSTTTTSTPSTP